MATKPPAFPARARSNPAAALDPAWVMELTEAAVSSRLNGVLAKRYAPQANAVAAFLRPIAAGYRSQAANAKNGYARRWFEKHAEHVEAWLVQLAAARCADV